MEKEKKKMGRHNLYNEPTIVLSVKVPKSQFMRLKTILEYELSKLKK